MVFKQCYNIMHNFVYKKFYHLKDAIAIVLDYFIISVTDNL